MAHGLPSLPNPSAPAQAQVIDFGGLNYGPAGGAGQLEDCRNLSTREYPCLSQRPGRKTVEGYDDCTGVYDYFGKLIVCAGGKLYMNGKEICNVSDEPKQFAVVNTQLVIWPDRIVVSLTEERVLQDCEPVVTANDASTVYDGSSITAPADIPIGEKHNIFDSAGSTTYTVYTYGHNVDKVKACWDMENGAWDWDKLADMEKLQNVVNVKAGDISIPGSSMYLVTGYAATPPNKTEYSTEGLFSVLGGWSGSTADGGEITISNTTYRVGLENTMFYEHFAVGDWVDVSGDPFGLVGAEHAQIGEVDAEANKLTFSGSDVMRLPVLYCPQKLGRLRAGEKVFFYQKFSKTGNSQVKSITAKEDIPAGCVPYLIASDGSPYTAGGTIYGYGIKKIRFWNQEKKEVYGPYEAYDVAKSEMPEDFTTMEPYPETYALTITRSLPKLDYICASDNRLWGVSNEEKTIWASELGMPFNFYTYAGKSTDSYAVPVGSDGEFTGCCEISDNVAFFKEDRVHLLIGKEPSAYALYDYQYHGVAKGSHASMTVINEQLFYLGTDGVYVFSASGSPQLISAAFGQRRFQNAVGGTDGKNYFISMQDSRTGDWGIWVFDAATGRWMQEDETQVLGFTNVSDKLYMVTADGELQIMHEEDSDEKVEWSATFCRIDETIHNRKCYSGLLLRYEADEGSTIKVEVKCDGGPWREVKNVRAESHRTSILPIRPNRCDSFQLRISGEGPVRLRSLVRKVTTGGLL